MSRQTLPAAHGAPLLAARLRVQAEDFVVVEMPRFEADGDGEHLLLEVEKRGLTTPQAAQRLAEWAGIAVAAVGWAGLKDRHAVTRQRFSLHLPGREAPATDPQDAALRVLSRARHRRKLPRGALAGNRFELRLREVTLGDGIARADVDARIGVLAAHGVPNYFGEQRFGRDGDNLDQARRMFAGARVRREQRSILLSAARSALFNHVLAARVTAGDWAGGRDGDVWMLEGSHSVFGPSPLDDTLRARAAAGDIHPTGPLWGRGALRSDGSVQALEQAAAATFPDLCRGLEAAGLAQERRALRVPVRALQHRWNQAGDLLLQFELPAGAYATGVLAELGDVRDVMRAAHA